MSDEIQDLKAALQGMPAGIQTQMANMVQTMALQAEQIEILQTQLQGFMGIDGPQPSDLTAAFSKAAQNTFSSSNAAKCVADLKGQIKKSDQWLGATLKAFQYAKEVVSFIK